MMRTLFDPPPHNRTRTSRAAAHGIAPRTPSLRAKVLDWLAEHPEGATNERIAEALGINPDTVKARVHELGCVGQVVALKALGTTRSGSGAFLFVTVENVAGRALEPWPRERTNWKARALAAEAALRATGGEVRQGVAP